LGALFIPRPWLALIPAALFFALYLASRKRPALAASLAWLSYTLYEYAMYRRWACSGECNIRIDLLAMYPVLILLSITAAAISLHAILSRPKNDGS
jgi:hypothetical protein